jgi:RNA polymerase sigma-70 factor (ECF subfamily)
MDDTERLQHEIVELLPRLRRFARSLTRNIDDADDVVQLALEKALERLDTWQRGTRLDSWMFTIIRNSWLDEVRSRSRRGEVNLDEEQAGQLRAAPSGVEDSLAIQKALSLMPEEQRSCVLLVLVEGLSYKETAGVLGVPIGTVTSRLARGREALQSILGPSPG